MKKKLLSALIFLILSLHFTKVYASDGFNSNPKNYNSRLEIFDGQKKVATFLVAIANDDQKRQNGLMNLKHLNFEFGMLFLFDHEDIINMWMKNTFIPLDIIFIDRDNIIADIIHNTKPLSLDVISSQKKVIKILEINSNLSKKLGIKIGQKINF